MSGSARRVGSLGGVGAVAVLTAVVSWAHRGPHRGAVQWCCGYSPARLASGQWRTLLGSALLVRHLKLFGLDAAVLLGVVLPYAEREGSKRALAVYFAGHIVATLAVVSLVLPLAAAGWGPAEVVRSQTDAGASAGLAAVAAAVAVSMRRRSLGLVLLAGLAVVFATDLVVAHRLSEVEHLIALGTGALIGRRFIAGSWPHRQADGVPGERRGSR